MKRYWYAVLAAFLLFPPPVACQTGSATVTVVDRSRVAVRVTPATFTGEVGDTITFSALAVDSITGDTISGVLRWTSGDSTGVSINPTTGKATLLRAGTYQVFADLMEIVGMVILNEQDDGTYREIYAEQRAAIYAATGVVPDTLRMKTGDTTHLCAYLEDVQGNHYRCKDCEWSSTNPAVASVSNTGTNFCPVWTPGFPFPQAQLQPLQLEQLRRLGVQISE